SSLIRSTPHNRTSSSMDKKHKHTLDEGSDKKRKNPKGYSMKWNTSGEGSSSQKPPSPPPSHQPTPPR
ncbi:hypothetical protein A2U01_0069817, partial [Trifolium medium]|nr:hypothetical protein [Trifolium medium]